MSDKIPWVDDNVRVLLEAIRDEAKKGQGAEFWLGRMALGRIERLASRALVIEQEKEVRPHGQD